MWQTLSRRLLAGLLAVGAASCASAIEQTPPTPPTRSEVPTVRSLAAVTEAVLADAAKRTGFDQASLKVESAVTLTWAEGITGLPEAGDDLHDGSCAGDRIEVSARPAARLSREPASAFRALSGGDGGGAAVRRDEAGLKGQGPRRAPVTCTVVASVRQWAKAASTARSARTMPAPKIT
jgi:hypothetical protein